MSKTLLRLALSLITLTPSAPLTPSPSSPTTGGSEFDVFLNFRGEDTRKRFIGHLYDDLAQHHGVSTFIDSEKLEKGEEIYKLFEYIERSKIFVPIFSERYAESKWCLKEVTKSLECEQEIVPVFFGVEPSDVRNQRGPFKSAFRKHESNKQLNQEEVRKWREALEKVAKHHCHFSTSIFKDDDIFLSNAALGVRLIKERASRKRVLLILDDVDSVEQLDAVAGERGWFGSGSVIIITTRNEEVLRAHSLKPDGIYKPELLNERQSWELFLLHAFNGEEPEGEYLRLSNEVVAAAGGLPLSRPYFRTYLEPVS